MNSRYNNDLDDEREDEREISLGATTILGIFFALVLICAVCFGFGYSMGRKSTPVIASIGTAAASDSNSQTLQKSSAATLPAPAPAPSENQPATASTTPESQPDQQTAQPQPAVRTVALVHPQPSAATAHAAPIAPQSIVVQVAAVSHKQDADILLTALKKRGYTGAIRQSPQDKLLHVQLGPFATKKDADAMRQRLIYDGYSPIVK